MRDPASSTLVGGLVYSFYTFLHSIQFLSSLKLRNGVSFRPSGLQVSAGPASRLCLRIPLQPASPTTAYYPNTTTMSARIKVNYLISSRLSLSIL